MNVAVWQGDFPAPLDPRHFAAAIDDDATSTSPRPRSAETAEGVSAPARRNRFPGSAVRTPVQSTALWVGIVGLSLVERMRMVCVRGTEARGRRIHMMGTRIARAQIFAAALLLTGCVTLSSQTGTYEDILAVGATYPAGKLPITRINRLFGRDPDALMEVVVGHRETRTETGEITHESIRIAYPEDHRCRLDFDDGPERFNEFMECVARSPDAIFGIIVGEVVSDEIRLHTILGFHVQPREEKQVDAAAGAITGAYPAGELPTSVGYREALPRP
ncbi:MAG: hypothetical protein OXU69_04330 [Gemmatimonadota bacterium]|nr:hypothetical protein [Gemmatimonadota bacterium]